MKLRCWFQQSPSCGARWRADLLVWPPYVEVWGPGCQRNSSTWRAVGGHMGGGECSRVMRWGQLFYQHCTRRTRAEQDPAGEWGAFSKERSTGAPFLTPRSLHPALYLLLALPLPSLLLAFPFLGRLIHGLKCDFLVCLMRQRSHPPRPHPTHSSNKPILRWN